MVEQELMTCRSDDGRDVWRVGNVNSLSGPDLREQPFSRILEASGRQKHTVRDVVRILRIVCGYRPE